MSLVKSFAGVNARIERSQYELENPNLMAVDTILDPSGGECVTYVRKGLVQTFSGLDTESIKADRQAWEKQYGGHQAVDETLLTPRDGKLTALVVYQPAA
jgi:hypothetical protein